mgnify:CR=1 FL=1
MNYIMLGRDDARAFHDVENDVLITFGDLKSLFPGKEVSKDAVDSYSRLLLLRQAKEKQRKMSSFQNNHIFQSSFYEDLMTRVYCKPLRQYNVERFNRSNVTKYERKDFQEKTKKKVYENLFFPIHDQQLQMWFLVILVPRFTKAWIVDFRKKTSSDSFEEDSVPLAHNCIKYFEKASTLYGHEEGERVWSIEPAVVPSLHHKFDSSVWMMSIMECMMRNYGIMRISSLDVCALRFLMMMELLHLNISSEGNNREIVFFK